MEPLFKRRQWLNPQHQPSNNWTSNITDEKIKKEFIQRLLENKDLFSRLAELILIHQYSNNEKRISLTSYEKPAWSEYQADANGYERALNDVLNYLKFIG
jgi:hypothetical protein